jgi:hypothetical protein
MRQLSAPALILSAIVLAGVAVSAHATSNYNYKPDEYVIVDGGSAPDRHLSLAAYGTEDLGYGFHVYLMAEPAHKIIVALPGIDDHIILDTAADAYHAAWSPDSRHVALHFRTDRHVETMLLYGLGERRPHLVDVPTLFQVATKLSDDSDAFEVRTDVTELTWQDATTFTMTERRVIEVKAPGLARKDLAQRLGAYGKPFDDSNDGDPGNTQPARHFMSFAAVATGKLGPNGARIVAIKPGQFDAP